MGEVESFDLGGHKISRGGRYQTDLGVKIETFKSILTGTQNLKTYIITCKF